MKSVKLQLSILIFVAVLLAALLPAFLGAAKAHAATYEGVNFIYVAEFKGGDKIGFVFGKSGETYWEAAISDGEIYILRHDDKDVKLKSAVCDAAGDTKLALVLNEGVAKLFVGDSSIASLVYSLEGYAGGGVNLTGDTKEELFISTDTLDGDIYIGGYSLVGEDMVFNLTDGNAKLSKAAGDFSFEKGVITISESYLKTLEADSEYRFRAVTTLTDLDFVVKTNFTAAKAEPSVDKYYVGNDVTIEVSGGAKVEKLLIDGEEFSYEQTGGKVVIKSSALSGLPLGSHSVKLYTDKGRPETSINISEAVETLTEPPEKIIFLWVDLAIFGAAIVGYITYTIVKKVRGKK